VDVEWIADPQAWIALASLTAIEIVLGIDNIVFITIMAAKAPPEKRALAQRVGLILAMGTRIALLFSLTWMMRLEDDLFAVFGMGISGRDLILIAGGLFLIVKSVLEIHEKLEGGEGRSVSAGTATFTSVVVQIAILDIVFSLDSVITAIGLANQLIIMVIAIVIAVIVMLIFVKPVSDFVERRPTIKMLALSFLLLIGFTLVGEGIDVEIPKGAIYFAMAFSAFVEMLNLKLRARGKGKGGTGPSAQADAPAA
jgi:predicted tellurium resistance membrane protein TerC